MIGKFYFFKNNEPFRGKLFLRRRLKRRRLRHNYLITLKITDKRVKRYIFKNKTLFSYNNNKILKKILNLYKLMTELKKI